MTTANIFKTVRSYAIIVFGLLLYALSWTAFLIPHKITGGGVSGIGALVYYATGIPMGYTYFLINVGLILLAIKMLGANFGVKTIFGVTVGAFLLSLLQMTIKVAVVEDKFMSTIIGGALAGVGLGVVFTQGGSTGGTDIIAMIINKYRNISPGRIIMLCDVFIIGSSFLVLLDLEPAKRIETIVYGYVAMAITAYSLDAVLSGSKQSVQVFVFSKRYQEIADRITSEINRGVTVVDGMGWYTKESQKVLISLVRKHEVSDVYKIIKEVDPEAFISVATVTGVYGRGFERIRH
ncbi:YitT family protein [Tenuifilum sp.]|uniref:YitT family protein n=1 Tax=Tenuifilum sp. TaxID=2760880 RepID=UPI001B7B2228|nr:YitT family protein [Bacteroidales bacterium]HOK61818.1 YitT family protein [Tenuifilum sp.]MBP9030000.1 YitT family protein [Bacteroidales bacterium]HOK86819.1 YitT family protein [Tenuifilum sp.]HON71268.1 YitT family protein [Tenuifilum sp.]